MDGDVIMSKIRGESKVQRQWYEEEDGEVEVRVFDEESEGRWRGKGMVGDGKGRIEVKDRRMKGEKG